MYNKQWNADNEGRNSEFKHGEPSACLQPQDTRTLFMKTISTIPYAMRFQFQTSNRLFGMKAKARQTIFRFHFSKSSTYS